MKTRMENGSFWAYDDLVGTLRDLESRSRRRSKSRGVDLEGAVSKHNLLRKSHPILIGPSTLDSLINSRPERFDYISEGKLPFNDLFFEFMYPHSVTLPFIGGDAGLLGVQLNKEYPGEGHSGKKSLGYRTFAYHQTPDGKVALFDFTLQNDLSPFTMSARILGGDLVHTVLPDESNNPTMGVVVPLRNPNIEVFQEIPPEEIEGARNYLNMMHGLSVNLVNFINAENVTVKKARHGRPIHRDPPRDPRSGRIHHNPHKPYHIVMINSGVVEEQERSEGGVLDWRVYVRGHDRRYRNEVGEIEKVTWVKPHIRGPASAPWKHHRYAALAGELEKEREMVKHYS